MQEQIHPLHTRLHIVSTPVAEFSVSVSSSPKLFCSSDDVIPRLFITENNTFN